MKIVFLLAVSLVLTRSAYAESISDGVAATVNGEVITVSELNRQLDTGFVSVSPNLPDSELEKEKNERRQEMLWALIDRDLLIQTFYRDGGKVSQDFVDASLNEIVKSEYGGDHAAFIQTLAERGITLKKYRHEIEDNYIVGQMRARFGSIPFSSLRKNADIKIY